MMGNNQFFVIAGAKGGVGKSAVALALTDLLVEKMDRQVLVVDSDTANADVAQSYEESNVKFEKQRLETEDDAIRFSRIIEENPNSCILLNTGAGDRFNDGIGIILDICREMKRNLVTLWVIGTDRDSVELLRDYQEVCGSSQVYVIVNSFFGDETDFDFYHKSKTKGTVKTIVFPKLSKIVASKIRQKWFNYERAITEKDKDGLFFLSIGERSALSRFREDVKNCFSDLLLNLGLMNGS